ncbi:533_t:CDS:1 [Ambispora gerdemannii]|uniref:Large ribosomal subunit protein mL40 n=1 Tax=Ambispora gerdemannii TaxID=144530 RepID=A0A9N8UW68_9GLOM|nr:533_t:CDS:1 [Ambispora gerdemannii]
MPFLSFSRITKKFDKFAAKITNSNLSLTCLYSSISLFYHNDNLRHHRRHYATKQTGPPPGVRGAPTTHITDTRYEVIKKILFENKKTRLPIMTQQDHEMHETIERAWKLFLRNRRRARNLEMRAKYRMIRKANLELEKLDPQLFKVSLNVHHDDRLFPKKMKVPTETPSLSGWDYNYVHVEKDDELDKKGVVGDDEDFE